MIQGLGCLIAFLFYVPISWSECSFTMHLNCGIMSATMIQSALLMERNSKKKYFDSVMCKFTPDSFKIDRIFQLFKCRAQSQRLTGRICDWIFGCAPKNSCVIAPVRRKTQSTVRLTSDYTYELELERRCVFNQSFFPMDSTNSIVLFRFDVLLHPRLFCFVINTADTCKYMLRTKHVLFAQWTIMSNVQF